jgi:hypothetical protein
MPTKLPYAVQPGSIRKIFDKIQEAKTPDRFTTDFLETKLGFRGGNYRQFIPLAKKLGLLGSDGSPTDLYKSFRNHHTSKVAMASAIKIGYREVFDRNEYAGALTRDQLKGLVVEITGLDANDRIVALVCQTFEMLKSMADFETRTETLEDKGSTDKSGSEPPTEAGRNGHELDLRLAYTINLVLPKTDDPAVFNAIFKALRDNLMRH